MIEISIVVPVYGCEPCLRELADRIRTTLESMGNTWELVLVDDRGPDFSWKVITELAANDPHVHGFQLSRNFGQQIAITAGLSVAQGKWMVVMDCDLQDRPELIADLYAKALEGFDIVYARRRQRTSSIFRRLSARMYFGMLNLFTGARMDGSYGSFSIISSKARDAYLQVRDQDRHYLFILRWLGFDNTAIDIVQASRTSGRSSYSVRALIKLAIDGVFFQTTVLLRGIVYLGFGISGIGAALALFLIAQRLTASHTYPGWTSVMVLLLCIGGMILISLGITGLYIGKVFDQVKGRPLFILDKQTDSFEPQSGIQGNELVDFANDHHH